MSLRAIRRGLLALLVTGAGYGAWMGHATLFAAGGHTQPSVHLVADGGIPTFPPPPQ